MTPSIRPSTKEAEELLALKIDPSSIISSESENSTYLPSVPIISSLDDKTKILQKKLSNLSISQNFKIFLQRDPENRIPKFLKNVKTNPSKKTKYRDGLYDDLFSRCIASILHICFIIYFI
jgi:hypothetical protein